MSEKIQKLSELEQTELELKQLELEERKLNLINLRQNIDQRKMYDEQQRAIYRDRGVVLNDKARTEHMTQAACTHKKGGIGMDGLNGQGDDNEYAVWKIRWFDGKMWVRCLRCSQTWKPVRLEQFCKVENGKAVAPVAPYDTIEAATAAFNQAQAEYKQACAFTTKNQPSGTTTYQFHDPKRYNEIMDGIDLR